MSEMDATDLVLVILAKLEGTHNAILKGITRIEKTAYILSISDEFKGLEKELEFEPHNYGPYSEKIAERLDLLAENKFVKSKDVAFSRQLENRADEISMEELQDTNEFIETKDYSLTDNGKAIAKHLIANLSKSQQKILDQVIREYGEVKFDEMMKKVYKVAPEEMLYRSKIRDKMGCG